MASQARINAVAGPALIRFDREDLDGLRELLFARYPNLEWATFIRCGWRETSAGLVLTLAHVCPPRDGDMDDSVGHVRITEQYSLRMALEAEGQPLAVGVVHSHPKDCPPDPSPTDDDMDSYYATYFGGFTPGRPYVSLILAEIDNELVVSGRVYWRDAWHFVNRVSSATASVRLWKRRSWNVATSSPRHARFAAAFGDEAALKLRTATVAVIGAGGTGSAAIEVLARAGVGRLIVADPDFVESSNLERLHGGVPSDAERRVPKVVVAAAHVRTIDPNCMVEGFIGALPQSEVLDAVVTADVMLGCTDQQHSRLALSDIARRYLIPSLDCGVALEGRNGRVSAQVGQWVRFLPRDPCPLCRRMIVPERVAQELMSPEERQRRITGAVRAAETGGRADRYWTEERQLNTVGYLTTMAGAMLAGYAIGWLTGSFLPPFERLQMNLSAPLLDVVEVEDVPTEGCTCRSALGYADQGEADALLTPPSHWPPVRRA